MHFLLIILRTGSPKENRTARQKGEQDGNDSRYTAHK